MVAFHIGTYAKDGGKGLVPVELDRDGAVAGEPFTGAANASFGVHSIRHDLTYLVDEQEEGAITVLRRDDSGWQGAARVPSRGDAPCYLALDAAEARLAVANYASGNVALFDLGADGIPRVAGEFQSHGSGPNTERQEGPHAHCVRFSPDDGSLYVVDLGADRVWRIALETSGIGEASVAWQTPPGMGPRHLLFHPRAPLAVLLSELSSELALLAVDGERLRPEGVLSTAPEGFSGENLGGHLATNAAGDRVYVSNRGHNSIAVFALDADGGELTLLQHVESGGEHPRHFIVFEDDRLLIAAHEKDGRIEAFEILGDGTLAPLRRGITVPGACFVLPDPARQTQAR